MFSELPNLAAPISTPSRHRTAADEVGIGSATGRATPKTCISASEVQCGPTSTQVIDPVMECIRYSFFRLREQKQMC